MNMKNESSYNPISDSLEEELFGNNTTEKVVLPQIQAKDYIKNSKPKQKIEEQDNEEDDETESSDQALKKLKFFIPPKLKRTCWLVSFLLLVGIVLLVIGLVHAIKDENFKSGITYFIIAFIVLIPGGFYTFQFIKARCVKDLDKREEILSEIPAL